tara:strand:- start:3337 stop:4599 length:1263 start_codon:yes stop_codon:yes gene_type:complete
MPDPRIKRPFPAIAAQVDARKIAGTALFTRVDDNAQVNVATLSTEARVYWDLPAFLHGYGSKATANLESVIGVNWGGAGKIKCGIGTDDLFFLRSTVAGITLLASEENKKFGFTGNDEFSVLDNGEYLLKASSPWRRGAFELAGSVQIKDSDTGIIYTVIDDFPRVQSLPTWIRPRGFSGDSDDAWDGLTVEDADPQDGAHWLVEPDGKVTVSYIAEGGFLLGTNLEFWHMLGGTGEEIPVDKLGDRKSLTTTYAAPSFLALDRQYVSMRRFFRGRTAGVIMTDGSVVSSSVPPLRGWDVVVRVQGPTMGPTVDQEKHLRAWWTHASRSMTFYPQWGDPDHADGAIEIRRHVDAYTTPSYEQYSHAVTAEADAVESHYSKRKGGRLMLRRDPGDGTERSEEYEGALDVFQDIRLSFLDKV